VKQIVDHLIWFQIIPMGLPPLFLIPDFLFAQRIFRLFSEWWIDLLRLSHFRPCSKIRSGLGISLCEMDSSVVGFQTTQSIDQLDEGLISKVPTTRSELSFMINSIHLSIIYIYVDASCLICSDSFSARALEWMNG
jgi:hypothetical protein